MYGYADGKQNRVPGGMLTQDMEWDWKTAKRVYLQPQEALPQLVGVSAAPPPGQLEQGERNQCYNYTTCSVMPYLYCMSSPAESAQARALDLLHVIP